jgi:hypothetical protein
MLQVFLKDVISLEVTILAALPGHFAIAPRVLPELERNWKRIDVEPPPPCGFVT